MGKKNHSISNSFLDFCSSSSSKQRGRIPHGTSVDQWMWSYLSRFSLVTEKWTLNLKKTQYAAARICRCRPSELSRCKISIVELLPELGYKPSSVEVMEAGGKRGSICPWPRRKMTQPHSLDPWVMMKPALCSNLLPRTKNQGSAELHNWEHEKPTAVSRRARVRLVFVMAG